MLNTQYVDISKGFDEYLDNLGLNHVEGAKEYIEATADYNNKWLRWIYFRHCVGITRAKATVDLKTLAKSKADMKADFDVTVEFQRIQSAAREKDEAKKHADRLHNRIPKKEKVRDKVDNLVEERFPRPDPKERF